MQVTPIIFCLVLISIVQAAIPKPKPNLVHSQDLQSSEIVKHKSPEERRKFSLFPKSSKKFVVSPEPIYKITTHKPMVHGTKKPLMKKLNLRNKNNRIVENQTQQPTISTEPMYKKNVAVTPKVDTVLVSKKISVEVVEDKFKEGKVKQNDNSEEKEKLQNDTNQMKTAMPNTENKESPNLKDLIYPHIAQSIEVSPEKKNIDASDVSDSTKHSKEIETPDWTEFIFIDPEHKLTESDKISSEDPAEYVTTEFYEEPEIVRQKRGINVIEEENLASTVAGYKYTWKDTRLNNDVAFKNIHS